MIIVPLDREGPRRLIAGTLTAEAGHLTGLAPFAQVPAAGSPAICDLLTELTGVGA